jgi:UDP-N-acetylmuramate dehydrogenase
VGGAVVSEKHANFFQAEPGATAADVRSLVLEVQRQVLVATGVELRPELRMVGFGEPESRASGDSGLAPGERGA